ncbi:hypothetical protein FEV09_09345 [Pseudanabaena catenata USMAC16]|uniref:Uncharacterized protein n=1 Tax=Pseudanabaena catenata USMAC16 TaxID=1855837 RepID=A0A9X4M8M8_9CYAN|nr:hypothetical protein [Pseudanabaena catenata]MDG3494763.1 hypothetical protein [Pseudanabaena catenata USMAC16]
MRHNLEHQQITSIPKCFALSAFTDRLSLLDLTTFSDACPYIARLRAKYSQNKAIAKIDRLRRECYAPTIIHRHHHHIA